MAVRYRKDRRRWMVDIELVLPTGEELRLRHASPVNTRLAAVAYEKKLIASAIERIAAPRGAPVTFGAFATKQFLAVYAEVNNKPSEIASKRSILTHHLLPAFGDRLLESLRVRDFEEYKARKLATGLAAKTINNQLAVLSRLLRVAEEWELIPRAPRVKLMRVTEPEVTFLDFAEAEGLLAAADPDWRTLFLLALRTGLRQGELRALRWDDVDLRRKRLFVRRAAWNDKIGTPKGGRSRELPLEDETLAALAALARRHDLAFSHASVRMHHRNEMKWPLWRACKRARIRRIGWHVLRHTFASHLVMRGIPLKVVQELLGHTDIRMTLRYAHVAPAVRRDAVEQLARPAPDWSRETAPTPAPEPEAP